MTAQAITHIPSHVKSNRHIMVARAHRRLGSFTTVHTFPILIFVYVYLTYMENGLVQARLQWKGPNLMFMGGRRHEVVSTGEQEGRIIRQNQNEETILTRSKTYGFYDHDQMYEIQSTTARTKSAKPGTTTTVAANLAQQFEQVQAARNNKKMKKNTSKSSRDIHVGHLLSASGELAQTLRKAGLGQCADIIEKNIQKIQNVYDHFPKDQRDSIEAIVRYELDSGVHNDRRRLKENSAAMGFLWLGRNMNYQYNMFLHMVEGEQPYEAARRAYEQDLKPHLSWAMQKICQAALTALKSVKTKIIFSRIGGFENHNFGSQEEEATVRDLQRLLGIWRPMVSRWKQIFEELDLAQI